jgi:RNA polymerase sigma-70 factor (ECF subfamily)
MREMLAEAAVAAFWDALDEPTRSRLRATTAATNATLADAWTRARHAWPELHVSSTRFCGYFAAHLGDAVALDGLRAEDLYLACGCIDGDTAALRAFEAALAEVANKLRSVARNDDVLGEAKQLTRQLLVARGDRPPALADYAGRGDLRGWLRVALGRELVRLVRAAEKSPRLATGEQALVVDRADDPETAYLKTHYREEFKAAFADALAQLDPTDRRLLRYAIIERLSIDDIARLDRIHRATAARQVVKARERLVAETRRVLGERLKLDGDRLQSIFGLIESQVDVSVQRLLAG